MNNKVLRYISAIYGFLIIGLSVIFIILMVDYFRNTLRFTFSDPLFHQVLSIISISHSIIIIIGGIILVRGSIHLKNELKKSLKTLLKGSYTIIILTLSLFLTSEFWFQLTTDGCSLFRWSIIIQYIIIFLIISLAPGLIIYFIKKRSKHLTITKKH